MIPAPTSPSPSRPHPTRRRRRNSSSSASSASSSSSSYTSPPHKRLCRPSPPARPFPITDADLSFHPVVNIGSNGNSNSNGNGNGNGHGNGNGNSNGTGNGRPQARISAVYGQKSAFPGLDEDDGKEGDGGYGCGGLWYGGEPGDGMEYLRMVRNEAKGVPHVLVGVEKTVAWEEEMGRGDAEMGGGYFNDGAFIATTESGMDGSAASRDEAVSGTQAAYYVSLGLRFRKDRLRLLQTPPLDKVTALTMDQPISLPPDSERARSQWRYLLQNQDPVMTQVACMDMESVLEVVKLVKSMLAGTVRGRNRERVGRLGAWTWSVLARCSEPGQLGSEEMSELRELGKRAVGLLVGLRDASGRNYDPDGEDDGFHEKDHEGEDEDDGIHDDLTKSNGTTYSVESQRVLGKGEGQDGLVSDRLEQAKAAMEDRYNLQDQLEGNEEEAGEVDAKGEPVSSLSSEPTRVLLDIIMTVVGDFYGQRDLLDFRDRWDH